MSVHPWSPIRRAERTPRATSRMICRTSLGNSALRFKCFFRTEGVPCEPDLYERSQAYAASEP